MQCHRDKPCEPDFMNRDLNVHVSIDHQFIKSKLALVTANKFSGNLSCVFTEHYPHINQKYMYTMFPLTGLLVNGTDGVPRYRDSPVTECPVNGNQVHKIR